MMGVLVQRLRKIWLFPTAIALLASLENTRANAQWPAAHEQMGTSNSGPLYASSPQNALASPKVWPADPQQFPPLHRFRPEADPVHFGAAQGCGPQFALHPTMPQSCISQCPANRFYGGFEFLWMRAHFDQNVAMIIDPPIGNTLTPFHYSPDLSPRAWLGWQSACSGAGFQATYWRFDATAAEERATAVAGATPVYLFVYGAGGNLSRNAYADLGETLVSNHSLMLHTLDLEGTQRFSLASLQCLAGLGVRIAEMDQHLRGEVYDATDSLWEIVTNDLSFQGAGPTVSLQIQRCLGDSRFALFNGLRGAFLFSDTHQGIYEMKDGFANEVTDTADQTEVLSMGELSLGMQYSHCIGTRAQFFVRGNFECQAWFDVGGPVDTHGTVAFSGIGLATGMLY